MDNSAEKNFPSVQNLLINIALYDKQDVTYFPDEVVRELEFFQGSIDAYCIECKKLSVFRSEALPPVKTLPVFDPNQIRTPPPKRLSGQEIRESLEEKCVQVDRVFSISLSCTRVTAHRIWFFFRIFKGNLIKVGQHPSLADFHLQNLDKYDQILPQEARREFGTAIGLHAHGVGVGSFVYLRRIFEGLIEEAHEKARLRPEWDEDRYCKCRMNEKVVLLKGFLPEALIENAAIYSTLSKGVHSLSEKECKEYFETLKIGIEYILDELLERRSKEKRAAKLKEEVARIRQSE